MPNRTRTHASCEAVPLKGQLSQHGGINDTKGLVNLKPRSYLTGEKFIAGGVGENRNVPKLANSFRKFFGEQISF